jgi:hypothetical protein
MERDEMCRVCDWVNAPLSAPDYEPGAFVRFMRAAGLVLLTILVAAAAAVAVLALWASSLAVAWEGDDGGITAYEVDVGRWGAAVDAQASRGEQMQLTVPPPPPARPAPTWTIWDDLAQCESGGDWHINTGNGFYGGLQFTLTSWRGVGGTGYPHQHSREEQIVRAERLQDIQGWGAWPACSRKIGLR